jgi:hypothetical protein
MFLVIISINFFFFVGGKVKFCAQKSIPSLPESFRVQLLEIKKKNSSRPEELEVIDQFLFYTTKDKEEDTNVSDSLERSVKFRGFR